MPTISRKYFNDHVTTSVFNNQERLALALEAIHKQSIVQSQEINPLTVRLLNVHNALTKISDCARGLAVRGFPSVFVQDGSYTGPVNNPELHGTAAQSGSMLYVQSFVTPKTGWTTDPFIRVRGMNDYYIEQRDSNTLRLIVSNSEVHTFMLYCGLYDFFANLDTTFDRIRLELNSIYFDGSKVLSSSTSNGNKFWAQYLDTNNTKVQSLVSHHYGALVSILTGPLSLGIDTNTGKYRHRLVHDGELDLLIDRHTGVVYLPDDPLATTLVYHTELLKLATKVYSDVQILFHDIYQQVILDIATRGALPLV